MAPESLIFCGSFGASSALTLLEAEDAGEASPARSVLSESEPQAVNPTKASDTAAAQMDIEGFMNPPLPRA